MKIDLSSIDLSQFYVNEHIINGEVCYLVNPQHIGCTWTKENKIFRSSLWNSQGELISASFPKFVNWGEKPDVFPVPTSLRGCTVVEKLDGSTLIVSKYNGQYIIRTRGTVDAANMEKNGQEIEIFKNEVLPKLFGGNNMNDTEDTWPSSFIFEWTSPLNQIVINYGDKPRFVLIGAIDHADYRLFSQSTLDDIARTFGLERPAIYTFKDVADLIGSVEQWQDAEGVCVYSNDDQEIHKCKSFNYLKLHRFKSNATFENTVDLFFQFDMPEYKEFEAKLIQTFDYECFLMVQGFISKICDGYKEVIKIIQGMNHFVETKLKNLPNRREQAAKVFESYGRETNRSSYVFKILDGKQLIEKDDLKKLLYQVTKS